MTEMVNAMVRVGPSQMEMLEYPMPEVPDDGALMKVVVAGICGTDVKMYKKPQSDDRVIMGHENIGYIAKAGKLFQERQGVKEGDLVFVEHYVTCMQCEWCHQGEYRHCASTDWRHNPNAIRYGYTSCENAPHLWGGFAEYMYLPWNAVLHKVPKGVSPELAGIVTPMANGIEWALFDCGVGYNSSVLIQGPGQQGMAQTVDRHCASTAWRHNPNAIRYGYTSCENAPHLWGGFAEYMYLPWNAVLHKVPKGVSPELAGIVTPMANGIEWALFDCGVGYNSSVLIQGPGQQGMAQTVACKQAGASCIIVTGTAKDVRRLEVAKILGADYTINVSEEDPLERIQEITAGIGVDVSLDCTSGAGTIPVTLGVEALKRKGGTILLQGELAEFPNFPIGKATVKYVTFKSARGHGYKSCELALEQLASNRFPLDLVTTHTYPLDQADTAVRAVAGEISNDVVHVSLLPNGPLE